jgi:hypothetical protein
MSPGTRVEDEGFVKIVAVAIESFTNGDIGTDEQ